MGIGKLDPSWGQPTRLAPNLGQKYSSRFMQQKPTLFYLTKNSG